MKIADIEIVKDNTAQSSCADGFLQLTRLLLRNHYQDGTFSEAYNCDIVSRKHTDAVAVCLYDMDTADRSIKVVLKEGARAPIYLRKHKELIVPDPGIYLTIVELVAGVLETADIVTDGIKQRAAIETKEEVGFDINIADIQQVGGETFASPGISDEKVFFCAAAIDHRHGGEIVGDGSVMEEVNAAVVFDLREALRMCRDGRIPDMKTEVGLMRLADHLSYLPQLDRFVHELPEDLQAAYDSLGINARLKQ